MTTQSDKWESLFRDSMEEVGLAYLPPEWRMGLWKQALEKFAAKVSAVSATPCREDGNHRFEVLLNGKLYLRTHTIGEADILCRAILDGEMGLPSIYDHMRKTEVMLEQ